MTAKYPKKARWARFLLDPVEERLASAMLDAKAGASGDFDGEEQKRRTLLMAEWIIARLPFYDLALVEKVDDLTDEEREAEYRRWLRAALNASESPPLGPNRPTDPDELDDMGDASESVQPPDHDLDAFHRAMREVATDG